MSDLRVAYEELRRRRPRPALAALDSVEDREGAVAASIGLVARGMLHAKAGERDEAQRCFEAAFELGVPLAALLRECGRYFNEAGDHERAYRCYSLLDRLVPGSLRVFLRDLPPAEACRYSPLTGPEVFAADRYYAMKDTKRALVRCLGVGGAALAVGGFSPGGRGGAARRLRLAGLHDFARERGLAFEELVAPKDVQMSGPRVFGGAEPPAIRGRSRSFFLCELPDVVVTGRSNLLVAGDRVLMDFQGDELGKVPLELDVDPAVLAADGSGVTVLSGDPDAELERAFSLVGMYTENFGHWVFEQLFKVFGSLGRPGFDGVPLLVDEEMPPQLVEALELFAGPGHPILAVERGARVAVRRLWACSMIAYWPGCEVLGTPSWPEAELADTDALSALLARVEPRLRALDGAERGGRLYLTRGGRRLVNRPEVERWFADRGFEVADFGRLPFVEQLRRIRGAELVVAEDGSVVYGLLFARPGLRIGVLAPPAPLEYEWCNEMFRSLGHRLLVLIGDAVREHPTYAKFSDFRVDPERLPAFVDALTAT